MRKSLGAAILLLFLATTECRGSPNTVILLGDPERIEREAKYFETIKFCRSPRLDIIIGLKPPIKDFEEIWNRETVRIEMRTKWPVDEYNRIMPLVLVWYNRVEKGQTRTLTDFPTYLSGDIVAHPQFNWLEAWRTYKKFLKEIAVNRPIGRKTLSSLIGEYSSLIDSCIYGFSS